MTCRTCKGNFDEVLPGSFNAGVDTETLQQIVADAEVMEDIERIGTIAEVSENPKSRAALEAGSFPPVKNTFKKCYLLALTAVIICVFNFLGGPIASSRCPTFCVCVLCAGRYFIQFFLYG